MKYLICLLVVLLGCQFALARNLLPEDDEGNDAKAQDDDMFLCLDKVLGGDLKALNTDDNTDKHDVMLARMTACSPLFNSAKLLI
ncbi:unnamed protein product [Diamesa hyperborea]